MTAFSLAPDAALHEQRVRNFMRFIRLVVARFPVLRGSEDEIVDEVVMRLGDRSADPAAPSYPSDAFICGVIVRVCQELSRKYSTDKPIRFAKAGKLAVAPEAKKPVTAGFERAEVIDLICDAVQASAAAMAGRDHVLAGAHEGLHAMGGRDLGYWLWYYVIWRADLWAGADADIEAETDAEWASVVAMSRGELVRLKRAYHALPSLLEPRLRQRPELRTLVSFVVRWNPRRNGADEA